MELPQSLAACKGRTEAARAAADAAAEKLAACRRELEGIERQRAEAEAIISAARPNVESFEARLAELDEQLAATKRKQVEAQGQLQPIRREAHQISDNLAEAKLSAATLVERTAYAERVRDARARDLESLAAQSNEATAQLRVKTVSAARIEPALALFEELARSVQRWTQSLEEQATAAQNSSTGLHASVTEARARTHEAQPSSMAQASASPRPACGRGASSSRWRRR